ncbi:MAG: hypothetical protein KGH75_13825, partial [Rhodospirillales bacterium]|nr:hypothetical protein [Rhodospirillales bacterium]
SQYNPTHGLAKELLWGFRDHLLLAGHRHIDHYQLIANPGEDFPSHLARVSGYKVADDYADEHHFRENRFAPAVAFVVQPNHPVPVERLKPYWDLEAAADFVAFLRKRKTA